MAVPQEKLSWMYETMYRIRRFEERLLEETAKGNETGGEHDGHLTIAIYTKTHDGIEITFNLYVTSLPEYFDMSRIFEGQRIMLNKEGWLRKKETNNANSSRH